MKVIVRGVIPSERLYQGKCSLCKSTIEAEHNELNHSHDQRDGDTSTVLCPVCQERTVYFCEVKK